MSTPLDQLRVLVVDDNHHMVMIVKTILRGFGIKQIVDAKDAAEALSRLRETRVDLIVVDYQMSFLDGVELVRLIRSANDVPDATLPIIMLTAHSERSRVLAARDAGVTEFCAKPVTPKDLWLKINACLSAPRSFVRAESFTGPERRRRRQASFSGTERRGGDRR